MYEGKYQNKYGLTTVTNTDADDKTAACTDPTVLSIQYLGLMTGPKWRCPWRHKLINRSVAQNIHSNDRAACTLNNIHRCT